MKAKIYLFLIIFILFSASNLFSSDKIIIEKAPGEIPGTVKIYDKGMQINPIAMPANNIIVKSINPIIFGLNDNQYQNSIPFYDNKVLYSATSNAVLSPTEHIALELDIKNSKINVIKTTYQLSEQAEQALEIAPIWLYDQLKIKFIELNKSKLDDDYAQLIINAADNIKDEVAFCVANMSYQTLTDSRFVGDKEMIVRNAEQIYSIAPSLQYVQLVEHGSIANKDYYTTTKYRIYDPVKQDTIWSEIPKEYYYWYIVHPKLDQEGVYVKDNSDDNSGQRTYGFSWRDFIRNNPDATHDYTQVNITTSKGSVKTIPVFGDLLKSPRILWDRNETYLPFGREFLPGNSALDVIGNWCSRALPVDVTLPRAFQPNQIIMKHNGNCNEDAFLFTAACRTALIPIIYLSTLAEDHVFGSIWDEDWHHFEFFRGGLHYPGNQFFGITNMLPRGSYGWKTSMAEGFRPDGFIENFTKYYADTCSFDLTVVDSKGIPIEGAMVQIYAPYGTGYQICEHLYTNRKGQVYFEAGAGKTYLVNVYHPIHGWSPADKTQAYYLAQTNTVKGAQYKVNVPYPNITLNDDSPENLNLPASSEYGFKLNFKSQEIISGISEHDNSQKSRFYKWNTEKDGIVSLFICNSENFNKFKNNQAFSAYYYVAYANGGEITLPLPAGDTWYLVLDNKSNANILEKVDVTCDLLQGNIMGIEDHKFDKTSIISPNPFDKYCRLELSPNIEKIKIFDIYGKLIDEIKYPFIWEPDKSLSNGTYFFIGYNGSQIINLQGNLFR
jgi:hypothetical protein